MLLVRLGSCLRVVGRRILVMVSTIPCLLFRLRLLFLLRFWVLRLALRVSMGVASLFFLVQTLFIAYSISNIRLKYLKILQVSTQGQNQSPRWRASNLLGPYFSASMLGKFGPNALLMVLTGKGFPCPGYIVVTLSSNRCLRLSLIAAVSSAAR